MTSEQRCLTYPLPRLVSVNGAQVDKQPYVPYEIVRTREQNGFFFSIQYWPYTNIRVTSRKVASPS